MVSRTFARSLATSLAVVALPSLATAQLPILGLWQFDETTGITAADIGPYGNTADLINFTTSGWVPGFTGNALQFDGIDDYAQIQQNGGLPFYTGYGEPFTISFRVNGAASDDDRVMALSSSVASEPLLTFGTGRNSNGTTSKLQIFRRSDANITFPHVYSNADVFDGTWHQVTYVEHSSYARVYVDGALDTSFPISTGTQIVTTDILTLGAINRPSNGTPLCCQWAGAIDDLQLYSYAASDADVAVLFAGGFLGVARPSVTTYGVGCDAGNAAAFGPFTLHAFGAPQLGGAMSLRTSNGQASTSPLLLISIGLPTFYDLSPFGAAPGCTLYTDPAGALVATLPPHDVWGSSVVAVPLPIPNLPLLSGFRLSISALDTAPGVVASNAVLAVIGS